MECSLNVPMCLFLAQHIQPRTIKEEASLHCVTGVQYRDFACLFCQWQTQMLLCLQPSFHGFPVETFPMVSWLLHKLPVLWHAMKGPMIHCWSPLQVDLISSLKQLPDSPGASLSQLVTSLTEMLLSASPFIFNIAQEGCSDIPC